MSEPEQEPATEPAEAPETPAETEPDAEPVEEPEEAEEPAGEPEEAAEEEEAPAETEEQPQGLSEKEIEKIGKALDRLRETNANRVSSILNEDALQLIPCPACADVAPAFVWHPDVAPPSDEASAGMRALLGLGAPRKLKRHPDFQTCPACDGEGFIDTGGKREGYTEAVCPKCTGKSYLSQGELTLPAQTNGKQEPVPVVTGPSVYGTELPPEAQALRDQGWMVAPPVVIPEVG